MFRLPDLRQRTGWNCGPVAVSLVLGHHGRIVPRTLPASPVDGMDPLAMVPIFRRANLGVLAGEMSLADLQFQTRQLRPVVCLVQFHGEGHYVVVCGVRHRRVYYHCPTDGYQNESTSEFMNRWWDRGRDCKYVQFGISTWCNTAQNVQG